jgi:uncharacterized protein YcgL (UPF0745 family)
MTLNGAKQHQMTRKITEERQIQTANIQQVKELIEHRPSCS